MRPAPRINDGIFSNPPAAASGAIALAARRPISLT